nr:hypothetical protein CFP56_68317 [Quercus suber]
MGSSCHPPQPTIERILDNHTSALIHSIVPEDDKDDASKTRRELSGTLVELTNLESASSSAYPVRTAGQLRKPKSRQHEVAVHVGMPSLLSRTPTQLAYGGSHCHHSSLILIRVRQPDAQRSLSRNVPSYAFVSSQGQDLNRLATAQPSNIMTDGCASRLPEFDCRVQHELASKDAYRGGLSERDPCKDRKAMTRTTATLARLTVYDYTDGPAITPDRARSQLVLPHGFCHANHESRTTELSAWYSHSGEAVLRAMKTCTYVSDRGPVNRPANTKDYISALFSYINLLLQRSVVAVLEKVLEKV